MTNEEAITYLECGAIPSCCCNSNKRHGGNCEGEEKVVEAINLAIKALEKQIPKKPYDIDTDYMTCECPECLSTLRSQDDIRNSDYCCVCGQAIDWSDAE